MRKQIPARTSEVGPGCFLLFAANIPAFRLSLSNRLLRRCVAADFLNALGWMSLTQAQAATSLSAKWEEGRCVQSHSGPGGLSLF